MIKVNFEYTTVVQASLSSQDERNLRQFAEEKGLSVEQAFQKWVEENRVPNFTYTTQETQPYPKKFTKIWYDEINEKSLNFEKW